jgi:hypothetical protein
VPADERDRLVDIHVAAAHYGGSVQSIYGLTRDGKIKNYGGTPGRYSLAEIEAVRSRQESTRST